MTMLNQPVPYPAPKARKKQCASVKDGDEALYAWGDAKRAGDIEAILAGQVDALAEGGQRAPGTHSNPVLSRVMAADEWRLSIALAVDNEIRQWRKDKYQRLWAQIADAIYAAPGHVTNAQAATAVGVSVPTVERCRTSMRRLILITARCAVR